MPDKPPGNPLLWPHSVALDRRVLPAQILELGWRSTVFRTPSRVCTFFQSTSCRASAAEEHRRPPLSGPRRSKLDAAEVKRWSGNRSECAGPSPSPPTGSGPPYGRTLANILPPDYAVLVGSALSLVCILIIQQSIHISLTFISYFFYFIWFMDDFIYSSSSIHFHICFDSYIEWFIYLSVPLSVMSMMFRDSRLWQIEIFRDQYYKFVTFERRNNRHRPLCRMSQSLDSALWRPDSQTQFRTMGRWDQLVDPVRSVHWGHPEYSVVRVEPDRELRLARVVHD